MKKHFMITATVAAFAAFQPAFAHEGAKHGTANHQEMNETSSNHTEAAPITTNDEAMKVIRHGVAFMGDALNKHQKDLFSDGKVMDQMHEVTGPVDDAVTFLEKHADTSEAAKKAHLLGALGQLTQSMTDFHIATHEKNLQNARSELKKIQAALKLVELYVK